MGKLTFQANLGGSVNLIGPNTASTVNLTLPSAAGSNGQPLVTDGSGNLSFATLTPAGGGTGITSLGTGVATALGTNVGSAGAFVVNGGALGTPSSGTLTNCTGLPNAGLVNSSITIGGTTIALGSSSNALANDITVYGVTVGRGAGAVSTNTAVGASALSNNTTGFNNTAIGIQSGFTNTTGTRGTFVGYQSGYTNNGDYNTAVGWSALYANTSGQLNSAIGDGALQSNTTGSENASVGQGSLTLNTTGSYNTALGRSALRSNTTASNNTAVGYQAAYSGTTGDGNTAVGQAALYSNQTGIFNVAIGNAAGYFSTAGGITAVGNYALNANTTGIANVAVGGRVNSVTTGTLVANTTGSYNTGIGSGALSSNTTGTNNTAVGYQAGYSSVTADSVTYIGDSAGINATGVSNTFIGKNSGYFVTSGTKNTILGRYNGNQGGLDIRTASNYIVLSDGDGNPRGIFDGSGNFLVGTTSLAFSNANNLMLQPSKGTVYYQHASGTASGEGYANFVYNGGVIGSITQSGTAAVLYNVTSDKRLKENIVDAPEFGGVIDSIQVRSFDWKTDHTHQRAGFIAQELVTVAPEAVHQPANPEEMMAVDYSKLVPMLVKEIQSLRKRLAALEAK